MLPFENLTPEETRVLHAILQGLSPTQLPHDVLDSLFKRAGVTSPVELLLYIYAEREGVSSERVA